MKLQNIANISIQKAALSVCLFVSFLFFVFFRVIVI